ncbi:Mu transposase domain-containing protein [Streptomyces sp. NPDC017546]|uniref:Mu transposase domain-containing protein n=1 Tax=Streptomyces sp. NPDC017546 TaxID=3365001 RepID=UPI0037A5562D
MLALPPVDPPAWWRFQTRLGRDHYVRVDTCDYSVDPIAIGRQVTVLTDNDQVLVLAPGGEIVAQHPRCWARHQTITDPNTPPPARRCARKCTGTGPAGRLKPRLLPGLWSMSSSASSALTTAFSPSSKAAPERRPADPPHHRRPGHRPGHGSPHWPADRR